MPKPFTATRPASRDHQNDNQGDKYAAYLQRSDNDVTLPEDKRRSIKTEFNLNSTPILSNIPIILSGALLAYALPSFLTEPLTTPHVISLALISSVHILFTLSAYMDNNGATNRTIPLIDDEFLKAQNNAFWERKISLIKDADKDLSHNKFLKPDTVALLATVPPHLLSEASDTLTITIVQARQLLASERRADNPGRYRSAPHPFTFSNQKLDPRKTEDRTTLRQRLEAVSVHLAEDAAFDVVHPELEKPAWAKRHWSEVFARAVFPPYFMVRDFYRKHTYKLPLPIVKEPALTPAADFSDKLEKFEAQHGRLDLPAMKR